MYCKKGHEIQVLNSAAGYYIGTVDKEDDFPNCRLTGYYKTWSEADELLYKNQTYIADTRDSSKNEFCNGGTGCGPFKHDRI